MNAFLECKIKDLPCAKHFVFTRFGIGVFDPKWLEYRIKLFSAVTLPSVVAQKNIDFVWVIFVDVDIDKESLQFLERCVGGYNFIYIVKVDFYADYFDISECLVGLSIDRNGSCLVSKIDDDDAWHKDTFAELYNELDDYYSVYVFPTGYDFLCQERIILKKNRPYITHNTHFCFKRKDSLPILRAGHHRVAELSENYSLHVKEISINKSMWLYSRHKQSDSRFSAVKNSILNSSAKTYLTSKVYDDFSFDMSCYDFYRQYASKASPADKGKTWDISQELQAEAAALKKKLREVKKKIIESTTNVL